MNAHCDATPPPSHQMCPCRPLIWGDVPQLAAAFRDPRIEQVLTAIETLDRTLSRKLSRLERKMSALSDVLADIDTATNEVAAKLDAQTAKIADLAAQLAAALPGSEQAAALQHQIDDAVTVIGTQSARLHSLAADPADPVPAPEPPVEGGAPVEG